MGSAEEVLQPDLNNGIGREERRSRKRTFQAEWTRQSPEEARSAAVGGSGGLNSWNLTMGGPAWRWHAGQGLWAQVSSLSLTP